MKPFAKLFTLLEQSTKPAGKESVLLDYFQNVSKADCLWAIAILSGRRPKRVITTALLQEWAIEFANIPKWLFDESYRVVGDLTETIALVLPPQTKQENQPLSYWIKYIRDLVLLEESQKRQEIHSAWEGLGATERFIFNKMLTGGFRLEVSQKLMVKTLAKVTGQPENVLAYRLVSNWTPDTTTFETLFLGENPGDETSKPYSFYQVPVLEVDPESLGSPDEWIAERKWDGVRAQIIVRNNALFVWSIEVELLTNKFPEFLPLAKLLPNGTVLDGEIIPFKAGTLLSFQLLQTRIGRKNVTKSILQEAPVVMICSDLLEWQGQDIRKKNVLERRTHLKQLLESHNTQGVLHYSRPIPFADWSELKQDRQKAHQNAIQGLLLKRKEAFYQMDQPEGDYWIWKAVPFTIDAVLIYAQRSSNRSAIFTNFTFAVWKEDQLVPFTKADTGLTDKEFIALSNWVQANTIERFGPVHSVQPQQVFEITFEGILASRRRKSGVELRLPTISHWHKDKPKEAANTLNDLLALLHPK